MIALLSLLVGTSAFALPIPRGVTHVSQLPDSFTAAYDFEGIVRLSNCSGSLIKLEGAKDTDKALVLTNGHCLETGFPDPGEVVYKRSSSRSFTLLDRSAGRAGTITATQILYGTMTKTDMAIYQVRETYAEIERNFHVRALMLASQRPAAGARIEVISGYWSRGYSCNLDRFIFKLKEENYVWNDSIKYTQPGCEVIHGTSGSPVIDSTSRSVVGVNNTGNDNGEECTMNNPCEIDESGKVSFAEGTSYGQQTFWVYSCLDRAGEMDVNQAGCLLPKPRAP